MVDMVWNMLSDIIILLCHSAGRNNSRRIHRGSNGVE